MKYYQGERLDNGQAVDICAMQLFGEGMKALLERKREAVLRMPGSGAMYERQFVETSQCVPSVGMDAL
jgi:hypothetical protein